MKKHLQRHWLLYLVLAVACAAFAYMACAGCSPVRIIRHEGMGAEG